MRLRLVRFVGVVCGVVAILLVAPIVCAASPDTTGAMHDSSPNQEVAVVIQCFSAAASMPSHHILMNLLAEQVRLPNRFILSQVTSLSWFPANLAFEPPLPAQGRPFQRPIIYIIPLSTLVEYHCRNYLNSEEPPL